MTSRRPPLATESSHRIAGPTEPDQAEDYRGDAPLLTVEQAAALLAVPPSWLKQRVAARTVTCTRLGRHIRFTGSSWPRSSRQASNH
jgi:excisionase family DNA binding protein